MDKLTGVEARAIAPVENPGVLSRSYCLGAIRFPGPSLADFVPRGYCRGDCVVCRRLSKVDGVGLVIRHFGSRI